MIDNATLAHAGVYTCVGTNPAGTVSREISVNAVTITVLGIYLEYRFYMYSSFQWILSYSADPLGMESIIGLAIMLLIILNDIALVALLLLLKSRKKRNFMKPVHSKNPSFGLSIANTLAGISKRRIWNHGSVEQLPKSCNDLRQPSVYIVYQQWGHHFEMKNMVPDLPSSARPRLPNSDE